MLPKYGFIPLLLKIFSHFLWPIFIFLLMPHFQIRATLIFETNWVKFSEKLENDWIIIKKKLKIVKNLKGNRNPRNAWCAWQHCDFSRSFVRKYHLPFTALFSVPARTKKSETSSLLNWEKPGIIIRKLKYCKNAGKSAVT